MKLFNFKNIKNFKNGNSAIYIIRRSTKVINKSIITYLISNFYLGKKK